MGFLTRADLQCCTVYESLGLGPTLGSVSFQKQELSAESPQQTGEVQ